MVRTYNSPITKTKLVIFDRDNTLIRDNGYTHKVEDLEWMPGALLNLQKLTESDFNIAIATNQSGIGRTLYSASDADIFHDKMVSEAKKSGGNIGSIVLCPHVPDDTGNPVCICRKPNPGMLVDLIKLYNPTETFMIGDKESDLKAAENAKIIGYRVTPNVDLDSIIREVLLK